MKRKALVILSIAILAFAMVPAIGAGAAAGDVKIVTPDQLASPSGRTGSAFERLTATQYVSDKTGTVDTLEDAGGTLYVVIEDNDATANPLTTYVAYFDNPGHSGAQGGDAFNIAVPETGAISGSGLSMVALGDGNGNPVDIDAEGFMRAAVAFADANRDGTIDDDDIVVQTGTYTAALADDNDQTPDIDESKIGFASASSVSNVFIGLSADRKTINLDGNRIAAGDVRIRFSSAIVNELISKPDSQGKTRSLVTVDSPSDDAITLSAKERSIAGYARSTDGGINHATFSATANESVDSGVFVAQFGVIRAEYKDAINAYWEEVPADISVTRTVRVITTAAETLENDGDSTADPPVAPAPNPDTVADGLTSTVIELTGVDNDNTLVSGSLEITFNNGNNAGDPAVARTNAIDTAATNGGITVGTPDTTTGAVSVTVVTTGATVTDDGDAATNDSADSFTVTYQTESAIGVIDAMLAVVNATGTDGQGDADIDEVFEEFCDSEIEGDRNKQCAAANALVMSVQGHAPNLGLTTAGSRVDALLALVIGVEHGDTVTVRYSDQSPRTVRTDSAEADLNGPTIGGFSLADGAYIAEDDFEVLFDVTDPDSGILEDSHDPDESAILSGMAYVTQQVTVAVGDGSHEDPQDAAELDVDDEITDGERYELTIDVTLEAETAEGDDDAPPVTLKVRVMITAFDSARNKSEKTVNYTVDTIDPEMQKVITGWGVNSRSGDAYVLVENQRDRIALVFDDAVQGDEVEAQDVSVPGSVVLRVLWLDNTGNNKIDIGDTDEGTGAADDLDYNDDTATSEVAEDVVEDLGLESGANKDARHILFLTLDEPLPTDATPTVEIDNNDLIDLAGNENRSDHRAVAEDRLAPAFEVTLGAKLSNGSLTATIVSSETLDRRPRATLALGDDSISVPASHDGDNNYSIDRGRAALGLGSKGADDGVWTLSISGMDENGNVGTSSAKWELDTTANNGANPDRRGGDSDALVAHELEVNEITFLTVEFNDEKGEYTEGRGTDSSNTVDITGLTLETLAAGDINAKNVAKKRADRTVESTAEVDAASAQTRDSIRHVVALSALTQGNYNLKVDYADAAGNTGSFDYVFQIIAPKPSTVDVVPGWSLVSIPGTPQDTSIGGVLTGSTVTDVWSLNNETKVWEFARVDENGEWMGTLTQIVDGRAYFVRSDTFDPISVLTERFNPQRTPSQYTVTAGWNGIGYTPAGGEGSVAADAYLSSLGASGWGMIRTWNTEASPPQYETYFSSGTGTTGFPGLGPDEDGIAKVEKGKGYLLFATRNGVIGG